MKMMSWMEVCKSNIQEWRRYTRSKGNKLYNGKTGDDVLQDVLLLSWKKFRNSNDDEEILSYIKLNLVRELDCLPKKASKKELKISDLKNEKNGIHKQTREESDSQE